MFECTYLHSKSPGEQLETFGRGFLSWKTLHVESWDVRTIQLRWFSLISQQCSLKKIYCKKFNAYKLFFGVILFSYIEAAIDLKIIQSVWMRIKVKQGLISNIVFKIDSCIFNWSNWIWDFASLLARFCWPVLRQLGVLIGLRFQ